jgi:hypothetical protein
VVCIQRGALIPALAGCRPAAIASLRRRWTRPQRARSAARPLMRCPPSTTEYRAHRPVGLIRERQPHQGGVPPCLTAHRNIRAISPLIQKAIPVVIAQPVRRRRGHSATAPTSRRPARDRSPSRRKHAWCLLENGSVEPMWRYDQTWARGKHRRYNGYVDRVGGVEGKRLRECLAAAIRDLLDWAAQQQAAQQAAPRAEKVDSDRESETDSGRDGGTDDTSA